jgi:putative hydrolase of the HAD superfamily
MDTPYELLFIDLDNTLTDRARIYERWSADFVRKYPEVAMGRGLQETRRALIEADGLGTVPRDRFCATIARLFPAGARPPVDKVWLEFAEAFIASIEPDPAVTDAVEQLGARYRLALLSNGGGERQRAKLERLGLESSFDRIFISDEVGADKPDPRIFEHALAVCGAPRDRALMIGDDAERDIAGALAIGLPACWIARGRAWSAAGVAATPTLVVQDLPDLVTRLLEARPLAQRTA